MTTFSSIINHGGIHTHFFKHMYARGTAGAEGEGHEVVMALSQDLSLRTFSTVLPPPPHPHPALPLPPSSCESGMVSPAAHQEERDDGNARDGSGP